MISAQPVRIDEKKADYLYHFAYDCITQEYPNKPGEVLGSDAYLAPPRVIHPAFYGCFDWHSSVHGHWALVTIIRHFPSFEKREEIIVKLKSTLARENILRETAYFDDVNNKDFERTYGWAWLLKLDEALRDWDDPVAGELHRNLLPLVDLLSAKLAEFLDKLNYPIRVGEHTNTAFALSFAYDYAKKYDPVLAKKIEEKARQYYLADCKCPITWEPSGFDFLSPCLQEASLMRKILPEKEFGKWLDAFLPGFRKNPGKFLKVAEVTDRSDGKLAHLDGLNFSRAWCLFEMGLPTKNRKMTALAGEHFTYSYEKMDSGEYAGAHWLASFALMALIKSEPVSLN
jgi:hypothetical protein